METPLEGSRVEQMIAELREHVDAKMNSVLDINKQLIEENIRLRHKIDGTMPPPPAQRNMDFKKNDEVPIISFHTTTEDDLIKFFIAKGRTYDLKDTIKSLGGSWVPSKKGWKVPLENKDELKNELEKKKATVVLEQ
mgnify:CR=1 FL=1|tara:strand:+ start:942 stop:1352 length:411 start_codon:yes stop_codon:yes gene_type:complete